MGVALEVNVGGTDVVLGGRSQSAQRPGAATGLNALAQDGQLSFSWSLPSTGGSAITGQTLTVTRISNGAQATGSPFSLTASATSKVVTGLTNGVAYRGSLTATNAIGTGPAATFDQTPQTPNQFDPLTYNWVANTGPTSFTGMTTVYGQHTADATGWWADATPGTKHAYASGTGTAGDPWIISGVNFRDDPALNTAGTAVSSRSTKRIAQLIVKHGYVEVQDSVSPIIAPPRLTSGGQSGVVARRCSMGRFDYRGDYSGGLPTTDKYTGGAIASTAFRQFAWDTSSRTGYYIDNGGSWTAGAWWWHYTSVGDPAKPVLTLNDTAASGALFLRASDRFNNTSNPLGWTITVASSGSNKNITLKNAAGTTLESYGNVANNGAAFATAMAGSTHLTVTTLGTTARPIANVTNAPLDWLITPVTTNRYWVEIVSGAKYVKDYWKWTGSGASATWTNVTASVNPNLVLPNDGNSYSPWFGTGANPDGIAAINCVIHTMEDGSQMTIPSSTDPTPTNHRFQYCLFYGDQGGRARANPHGDHIQFTGGQTIRVQRCRFISPFRTWNPGGGETTYSSIMLLKCDDRGIDDVLVSESWLDSAQNTIQLYTMSTTRRVTTVRIRNNVFPTSGTATYCSFDSGTPLITWTDNKDVNGIAIPATSSRITGKIGAANASGTLLATVDSDPSREGYNLA